tara:strand:- start:94064 stop:94648 length:585 start_codon:yes stop_codon:yes gene_type:complete
MHLKALKRILFAAMLVGLSACGGGGPPANPIPTASGKIDLSKEALVYFKVNKDYGSGKLGFIKFYIQKEGTSQIRDYICGKDNRIPIAERLAPGRYVFVLMSGNIIATPVEPVPVVTYDPSKGIPLTPIDVKAGDVLYLGNVLVSGIGKKTAIGRADSVVYTVEDHSDLAKKSVAEYYPELASRLQTRLIKVLP